MTDEKQPGVNRRRVLATTGSIVGGLSISSGHVGSQSNKKTAREVFKQRIQSSLQYKNATQSLKKWRDYLEKQDITVHSNKFSVGPSSSESSSSGKFAGTQHISDQEALDITISLAVDGCGNYYTDLTWTYNKQQNGWHEDTGKPPLDGTGLYYNENWWNVLYDSVSETTETSKYVAYKDGSYGGNGPGFTVNDNNIWLYDDENKYHWAGVYLESVGDYSEDQRQVYGEYIHNWWEERTRVDSINVSYPAGISISYTKEEYVDEWKTDTEDDGDTFLKIKQSEATQNTYQCRY